MWGLIIALGMNFGWGNHPTYSNPVFWNNHEEIYEHDHEDYIFWYNGEIVDEHDDFIIPEDCTLLQIETGDCGFGIVNS